MTAFEWKTFFVWRVTYICVHVTQAQFLPTSSKHVSPGMRFLGLGIGGLSHQSCMSLHIGTNNIVGGSIKKIPREPITNQLKIAVENQLTINCRQSAGIWRCNWKFGVSLNFFENLQQLMCLYLGLYSISSWSPRRDGKHGGRKLFSRL